MATAAAPTTGQPVVAPKKDRTHYLYIAVIIAVLLGIAVGFIAPDFAKQLKPIGTGFVNLIKMMISPVIFCSIVIGVGSVRSAAQVGKVGSIALGYFVVMSTVALGIGLVVGNIIHPGEGLRLVTGKPPAAPEKTTTADFILHMIPDTLFSSLTSGVVSQTLVVALLVGFALQAMGKAGKPILVGVGHLQRLVFRVLTMIMWAAPIGAFGAIAAVVGETGVDALKALAVIIASAMGAPLTVGQQISLLVFMMIASKGAAGVTGAGLATLAGGLASHRPDLVEGVGLVVGIDRFMSEARAVTNFSGNAVATLLVGAWTKSIDREQVDKVLAGEAPFDETTMLDEHDLDTNPDGTNHDGTDHDFTQEPAKV